MGKLTDIFLQDNGKPRENTGKHKEKQESELELLLTPIVPDGVTLDKLGLEQEYSFSKIADNLDYITIGILEIGRYVKPRDKQKEPFEPEPKNKISLPNPRFIPGLIELINKSQVCYLDEPEAKGIKMINRCNDLSSSYDNISREHIEITKKPEGYFIQNLADSNTALYINEKVGFELSSKTNFKLKDGMIIALGRPSVKDGTISASHYPLRFKILLRNKQDANKISTKTSKTAPFY